MHWELWEEKKHDLAMAPAEGGLVELPTDPQGIQLQSYPDVSEARIRGLSYGHRPGLEVGCPGREELKGLSSCCCVLRSPS